MRRLLILACSIVMVDTVFHAALVPLIPYFTDELGLSKLGVGVLTGAFGAGVLLGSVPGGYLVSKAGVKASAISGFAIFSVTSVVFAFAESGWLLILARFGEGFGSALSWVAAFTWVITNVGGERRGQAIGTLMSSAVVGALLGPVVGSIAAIVGLTPTFITVAVLGLVIAVWVYATPAPPPQPDRLFFPMVRRLFDRNLVTGMWLVTLSPLLFGAPIVLVPLALDSLGWGAAAIGAVFLVAAGLEAFAQPLLGRWSDRVGFKLPLVATLSGSVVLLLVFPFAGEVGLLLAALVVLAAVFLNGSVTPGTSMFSRASEGVGVDQAIVFGAVNFAWATGSALGAPLAGAVSDLGGPTYGDTLAYLLLAGICTLALVNISRRKKLA
ncbi:MAG: MFS transporter [Rubrobacter sp.]